MAHTTKKTWKLQEFMGHSAEVKCLALGHKSGRVLVTGGEDRKVNLWSVGKPNCIMSLTGHTTAVESVRFGHDEELVVAGSFSGALKLWDLEEAKILRTLTGHKAGIKSLDFHPYGNYVASGSMDCTVKLWDVRRKGCIYTYKSHTNCVNCLRFTPDGQWIASASDDGTIKIWDLTAGKLLQELNLHKGPVNVVEFHPSDLLLASGSSDRTVRFWDLETFQNICTSDTDKHPVKSIAFHPEGLCLYSSGGDSLKVYGWEPLICHDVVPVAWPDVADMAITNSQLIGATFNKCNIAEYVVDLKKVAPVGAPSKSESVRSALTSSNGRKSFITDRPPTSSTREASEPKRSNTPPEKNDGGDEESSVSRADIQNQDDYRLLFQGQGKKYAKAQKAEPFQPPYDDEIPEPVKIPKPVTPSERKDVKKEASSISSDRREGKKEISPRPKPSASKQVKDSIQAEDFLPKTPNVNEMSDSEMIQSLMQGHSTMTTVLQQRSRNLQVVRAMWTSGNTKTAMDAAISMKDKAVMVDLLNIINSRATLWNLDMCNLLLPQLKDIMASKYDSHVITASTSVKLVLRNFGSVIKSNMQEPPSAFVDISREERHKKCLACFTVLSSIKSMIQTSVSSASPKVSNLYREVMLLMSTLE